MPSKSLSSIFNSVVFILLCFSSLSFSFSSATSTPSTTATGITTPPPLSKNDSIITSNDNSTNEGTLVTKLVNRLMHDQNTLIQASSALLIVVFLIFVVILVKFVARRRRASKVRKYGVIMEDGAVEIRPLEGANADDDVDDDEDETLFDKKSVVGGDRKKLLP